MRPEAAVSGERQIVEEADLSPAVLVNYFQAEEADIPALLKA